MNNILKHEGYNPWFIFAATTLGSFMVNVDTTIVNVALPIIANDYSEKITNIQWIISSYILTVCVLLPMCGRLSDIYTKRFIYLFVSLIYQVPLLIYFSLDAIHHLPRR